MALPLIAPATWRPKFIDIGINLTDPVYQGIYHNKTHHPPDIPAVLGRARAIGCTKMIVTGSDVASSVQAIKLCEKHADICYATVGVHPCSSGQFTSSSTGADDMLTQLRTLASSKYVVAFGEIGLDYDRLALCDKETQLHFFERQLEIAVEVQLPLFLHSRAAHVDFIRVLGAQEDKLPRRGVVHSFTGTKEEMQELVARGWDIGINGCSLKTEENLEVVRQVPLNRLHVESDGPWCEIRSSSAAAALLQRLEREERLGAGGVAGLDGGVKAVKKEKWVEGAVVKGRNEPASVVKVAWAVAALKNLELRDIVDAAWANSVRIFGLGEVAECNGEE